MAVAKDWEMLPNSDLRDRVNWRALGNDRFAALRARILIVRSDGKESRFGPVIRAFNVAPGNTIELRTKREQVISQTTTISDAIRFTTTSRVCDQLMVKLSAELSAKVPGFSGKLGSEILSKSEYEITKTTEYQLSATTSHVIQEMEGDEHGITLTGGDSPRVEEFRRRYWPRQWDVYLHSYEYLELSYKSSWLWWGDVRKTIKKTDSGVLGWPLVSVTFFEPQLGQDVCHGPVADELTSPDAIEIRPLADAMPSALAPRAESLEDLAKLAFPVTKDEKKAASRPKKRAAKARPKKRARKAAKKKSAKRAPHKKAKKKR